MDYENKYNEALKVMESLYNVVRYQSSTDALLTYQTLEKAFPELHESEDERIRKGLIKGLSAMKNIHNRQTFSDDAINIDDAIAWVEKQGEQKPIDDSEPKFKVGDWITNGEYLWQITNIDRLDYTLKSQNGDVVEDNINYVENEFHIWTIQDAKDGDVLSQDSIPFIFKRWDNNCIAYCGITDFGLFKVVEDDFSWCNGINVTPATKEQCDFLFQKMKEAGYKWDAEKKELKKIEQKPSWNEEDEEMLKSIIATCKLAEQDRDSSPARHLFETQTNWLKSLKDRVQPQPKQEWNEKDTKILQGVIHSIKISRSACEEDDDIKDRYDEELDWLKSLKPNHWKPSEEQMESLLYTLGRGGAYNHEALTKLYNDLKKL